MTDLYMGGRGVMKRTEELSDRMWDEMGPAWIGSVLAAMSAFCAVVSIAFESYFLGIALIAPIPVGIAMALPWFKTKAEIAAHRQAMAAETAKHGKGWAKD